MDELLSYPYVVAFVMSIAAVGTLSVGVYVYARRGEKAMASAVALCALVVVGIALSHIAGM